MALFLAESTDKYLFYVASGNGHYARGWRQTENGKEAVPVLKRLLVGGADTQGRVGKQLARRCGLNPSCPKCGLWIVDYQHWPHHKPIKDEDSQALLQTYQIVI